MKEIWFVEFCSEEETTGEVCVFQMVIDTLDQKVGDGNTGK